MDFSKAIKMAKADRLRVARKLWSTEYWLQCVDRVPGRYLRYAMALDGRAFGATATGVHVELADPKLGPLVVVTLAWGSVFRPGAEVHTYEPPLEDILATDWEAVDDKTVETIVQNCRKPHDAA